MRDAASAELREIAGSELYRRNAFRITGLPTTVDRRTARQRQQQLNAALQVGADIDTGSGQPADPDEVRAAFDRILGDPRRRLVEEVFWLWDTGDTTCNCPRQVHKAHDEAVRAHAAVLSEEIAGQKPANASRLDDAWNAASQNWRTALAAPAFWNHLRHRVTSLDDRQLTVADAESLRTELPLALLKPLTDLASAAPDPARLAAHARKWPAPEMEINLRLEEAAAPLYDEVDTEVRTALEILDTGDTDRAANHIYIAARPPLHRLTKLVPHKRHRRTAESRDKVSVALNNCATRLIEAGAVFDGRAEKWLNDAAELAAGPRSLDTIHQNQRALREMRDGLTEIATQIARLQSLGMKSQARAALRELQRANRNGPGAAEIDRMLRDLNAGRRVGVPTGSSYRPPTQEPSDYQPSTYLAGGGRRRGRTLFKLLIAAAVIFAIIRFWPFGGDSKQGMVFGAKISANQPIGSCLKTEKDWQKETEIVDCGEKHWGEVIAYLKITAAPATYPGENQTLALASFQCGEAFAQQGIAGDKYTTTFAVGGRQDWNSNGYENYTTCVAHHRDDEEFKGRIGKPDSPKVPKPVTMNLSSLQIRDNAPVGLCLQHEPTDENSKASIVRCELSHWGELLGYPELVQYRDRNPGADTLKTASDAQCVNLFNRRSPGAKGFTKWYVYPGPTWWDEPDSAKYSYCVLVRDDGKPFKGKP